RRLINDDNGEVLGLPVNLIIIVLIMILALPIIWSFAGLYIHNQVETNLIVELNTLKKSIQEVSNSEVQNKRIINLEIRDHPLAKLEYVEVGGNSPRKSKSIRFRFQDNSEKTIYLNTGTVANITEQGLSYLELPEGQIQLFLEKKSYSKNELVIIGMIEGDVNQ
ncbi:MAG: hypothetical protein ACOC5T_07170, partial [Elusimicrobiota bacterium]